MCFHCDNGNTKKEKIVGEIPHDFGIWMRTLPSSPRLTRWKRHRCLRCRGIGEYQVKKPLWLRRLIASWKAYRGSEYGGLLTNWKQGEFEIIAEWKTDQGCEEVWQLVENLYESGRDEIYVALVKMGYNKGYFVIHGDGFHMPIAFWDGYFSFDDAYKLMKARCRVIGTKMGYRNLEVDNAQTEN